MLPARPLSSIRPWLLRTRSRKTIFKLASWQGARIHGVVHPASMASLLRTGALRAPRALAASVPSSSTSVLRSSSALLHTSRAALSEKDPQLGDFPDVPYQSRQLRKWSPTWWDGQDKMNFGETVSEPEGRNCKGERIGPASSSRAHTLMRSPA